MTTSNGNWENAATGLFARMKSAADDFIAGRGWSTAAIAVESYDEAHHEMAFTLLASFTNLTTSEVRSKVQFALSTNQRVTPTVPEESNSTANGNLAKGSGEWVPFPTNLLPEPLQSFVKQAAPATAGDESSLSLQLLALLASCVGTTRVLRVKSDWRESSSLWCVSIARSGLKKSPQFRAITELIAPHCLKAHRDYLSAVEAYERDLDEYNRSKRRSSGDEISEPPEAPRERQYLLADTTSEGMLTVLKDNPRGCILARDELAGWFKSFGAYKEGRGGDAESWLETYNGGPQNINRKGGGLREKHVFIPHALMSVTGFIQPDILKRVVSQEAIDQGLLARFMLCWPPEKQWRYNDDEVNPRLQAAVIGVIDWLLGLNHDPNGNAVDIPFTPEAKKIFVEHINKIQERIEGAKINSLRAAYSKIEGVAARLALVLHLVRVASGDDVDATAVDAQTTRAGINIAWWLADEEDRVYRQMGWAVEPKQTLDERLLGLLRAAPLGLTATEIHRATQNHIKASELKAAIDDLEVKGLIRSMRDEPVGFKKPSVRWYAVMADA